jgi:hypothetical protein
LVASMVSFPFPCPETDIDFLISDWLCSRYDHSYPYLFSQDERLGDPKGRTFEFKSCSGAVVDDVIEDQIPALSSNQQVILVSAGGYRSYILVNLKLICYRR